MHIHTQRCAARLKEGDAVLLVGLSKAELNGQRGEIMPFAAAS